MKSEKQCTGKLEELVNGLTVAANAVPDDGSEPTAEQGAEIGALVSAIGIMAWVLDCESEFAGFLRTMKLAATAQKLGEAGVSLPQQEG